jgi:antitoxin ParD1/3/4
MDYKDTAEVAVRRRHLEGIFLLQGRHIYYRQIRRIVVMANVEKVSIALTPEILAVVREAVESGEYASSSEVIREALREWKRRRALERKHVEELRLLWEEGLESSPGRLADMAAIKAEARRRLVSAQDTEATGA